MRTIKFRAYDEENSKMWFFGIEEPLMVCGEECNGLTFNDCPFVKSTIMQFTRLLDKNGQEIYEGDILEEVLNKGKVYWNNDISGFIAENIGGGHLWRDCKVIGNIYQNPELLN